MATSTLLREPLCNEGPALPFEKSNFEDRIEMDSVIVVSSQNDNSGDHSQGSPPTGGPKEVVGLVSFKAESMQPFNSQSELHFISATQPPFDSMTAPHFDSTSQPHFHTDVLPSFHDGRGVSLKPSDPSEQQLDVHRSKNSFLVAESNAAYLELQCEVVSESPLSDVLPSRKVSRREVADEPCKRLWPDQPSEVSSIRKLDLSDYMRIGKYSCDVCFKVFPKSVKLMEHKRTHTGERPHRCDKCGKSFGQSSTFREHMKRLHAEERPHKCDCCGKAFALLKDFELHVRIHSGEKPHRCDTCGRGFSQMAHLTGHMKTHTKERPFNCTVCEKSFSTSRTLLHHTRLHTGEKPHQCSVCGKAFAHLNSLNYHMKAQGNHHVALS